LLATTSLKVVATHKTTVSQSFKDVNELSTIVNNYESKMVDSKASKSLDLVLKM